MVHEGSCRGNSAATDHCKKPSWAKLKLVHTILQAASAKTVPAGGALKGRVARIIKAFYWWSCRHGHERARSCLAESG